MPTVPRRFTWPETAGTESAGGHPLPSCGRGGEQCPCTEQEKKGEQKADS